MGKAILIIGSFKIFFFIATSFMYTVETKVDYKAIRLLTKDGNHWFLGKGSGEKTKILISFMVIQVIILNL